MRKALYILADLNEADVRWLAEAGAVIEASDGEEALLVRRNDPAALDAALKSVADWVRDVTG